MKNISILGTCIVDKVKTINNYPKEGMLVNINNISNSVGGCLCNTSINLKVLDKDNLNVKVFGKIGNDNEGKFISNTLLKYGIDISNLKIDNNDQTGFTDVMTNISNGNRTFYHYKGTNKTFDIDDIDLDYFKNNPSLVHIGYLMLLDALDSYDDTYGTRMAKLLSILKDYHCMISLDLVSQDSDNFKNVVMPSLKYVDYLIINEIELSLLTDINVRDNDNNINIDNLKLAIQKINNINPNIIKIIIHCPELGICYENNTFEILGSLILPKEYIKGSVGAGDCFCAGCLYGILNNYTNKEILTIASLNAANNLAFYDSISGANSKKEILKLDKLFKRRVYEI